jgi:hypothetical protein
MNDILNKLLRFIPFPIFFYFQADNFFLNISDIYSKSIPMDFNNILLANQYVTKQKPAKRDATKKSDFYNNKKYLSWEYLK